MTFGMPGLQLFVQQLVFVRSSAVAFQTGHLHSEEEIRTPTCPPFPTYFPLEMT